MPNLNCICPGDNKHKISFKKIYQARLETIAGTDDGVILFQYLRISIVLLAKENSNIKK
jgi:hypothetical protein